MSRLTSLWIRQGGEKAAASWRRTYTESQRSGAAAVGRGKEAGGSTGRVLRGGIRAAHPVRQGSVPFFQGKDKLCLVPRAAWSPDQTSEVSEDFGSFGSERHRPLGVSTRAA